MLNGRSVARCWYVGAGRATTQAKPRRPPPRSAEDCSLKFDFAAAASIADPDRPLHVRADYDTLLTNLLILQWLFVIPPVVAKETHAEAAARASHGRCGATTALMSHPQVAPYTGVVWEPLRCTAPPPRAGTNRILAFRGGPRICSDRELRHAALTPNRSAPTLLDRRLVIVAASRSGIYNVVPTIPTPDRVCSLRPAARSITSRSVPSRFPICPIRP